MARCSILALVMNQKLRFLGVFRTIYYLPSVLPGVAVVVLWMWILHPDAGLLNTLLSYVGIDGPRWLAHPDWALPGLLMMSLWGLGRSMVIYLASLQIPSELITLIPYAATVIALTISWCQRMREGGWVPGPRTELNSRIFSHTVRSLT